MLSSELHLTLQHSSKHSGLRQWQIQKGFMRFKPPQFGKKNTLLCNSVTSE